MTMPIELVGAGAMEIERIRGYYMLSFKALGPRTHEYMQNAEHSAI